MNSLEIKEKRLKLGLSQKTLAKLVGVSTQTINGYENGKKIPTTKYQILEQTLNKKPSTIDVKKHRLRLGLTQEKLAKMIDVSTNTIINYENGGSISESKKEILNLIFNKVDLDARDYHESQSGELIYMPWSQFNDKLNKNQLIKISNSVINQIDNYKKAIDSLNEIHKNILTQIEMLEIIEVQEEIWKDIINPKKDDLNTST